MLRWAAIGTGFITNTMVAAIEQSPGSRLDVVAGRSTERTEIFRAQHGIDRALSIEAAISDPRIDAVYIGTPNHAHHELAVTAARAGKAVLSEKSLTRTMATARELVDGVRLTNAFFVEGLMYLAHPLYETVVDVLGDGRLGELRSVSGKYAANIWHVVNAAGGGTLYNIGCYPTSLLHLVVQTMCGPAAFGERSAVAVGTRNSDGNVSNTAISIRFDNGVLASLQSTDEYGMAHAFTVTGNNGTLTFDTNPWLPVAGRNQLTWQPFDGVAEVIVVNDDHDAFFHQVQMVERHVTAGDTEATRPSPRLDDSLEIMQLLTDWEAAVPARLRRPQS
ncbi:MAG: putative dehydrogenase [Ilumatobacter sp.]|jgi:predicted dehydrogenase